MPQIVNSSEECTCKDEVRVYKDEGEEEDEKNRSSENLSEDKVNLVTEGEDQVSKISKFRITAAEQFIYHFRNH